MDYKNFSGKYIIYESNEKGKEYDEFTRSLIYKGGYLKGERSGNGIEFTYLVEKIRYKGEYLNGRRNGKGKEYHFNGKLKFKGEYLNGKIIYGIGYKDLSNKKKYEKKELEEEYNK